jgi:hypothetical protein
MIMMMYFGLVVDEMINLMNVLLGNEEGLSNWLDDVRLWNFGLVDDGLWEFLDLRGVEGIGFVVVGKLLGLVLMAIMIILSMN